MRITDPRWPAVREVARRLLRLDNLKVCGPSWMEPEIDELNLMMGDKLPARLMFPSYEFCEEGILHVLDATTLTPLAQVGGSEPNTTILWLPMQTRVAWEAIKTTCVDLLEAGYPGCIGCAGPEAELEWDEIQHRRAVNYEGKNADMK